MKTLRYVNGAAVGVALALVLGGSPVMGESASMVVTKKGVPGGVSISSVKLTAQITAVEPAKREFTILRPDGVKKTFIAGPEIANYDQIRVGDEVVLTLAQALVVFMPKNGEPRAASESATVAVAPKGSKPALVITDSSEVTAQVKSLNLEKHQATLEFPEGLSQVVNVREDVDLSKVKVGDAVTIRITEAMAIRVEKP